MTTAQFDLIAFDADDTLWHSENLYEAAENDFVEICSAYANAELARAGLHQTEVRNLPLYGYGVKAFVLSMTETLIGLSEGRATAGEIARLLARGKEMLSAEVHLLDGTAAVLEELACGFPLMVITKGDLGHQASKLARSGLAPFFKYVEIVVDKSPDVYRDLLTKHGFDPRRVLMVGNSPRSDILPMLELGGWGVWVPYRILWAHEHAHLSDNLGPRFREIDRIGDLPRLIRELTAEA